MCRFPARETPDLEVDPAKIFSFSDFKAIENLINVGGIDRNIAFILSDYARSSILYCIPSIDRVYADHRLLLADSICKLEPILFALNIIPDITLTELNEKLNFRITEKKLANLRQNPIY